MPVVNVVRPSIKVLSPPTSIQTPTTWTVRSLKTALDEHERGQFSQSALLSTSLDRDDRIAPCIDDRINALVGGGAAEFSIQPAEKFIRRSKAVISRLDWWNETVTSAWLRSVLRDNIKMGFHLSRVPWARTGRSWYPLKPIRWNPEFVYYSEEDGHLVAHSDQGPLPVLPGDPNWFLSLPGGDQSWMSGAVRGLGLPYLMRQFTPRDWARYNERHGLPIIVIKEPYGSGDEKEKKNFYSGVRKMGSSGILRTPQGPDDSRSYGAELLEAKSRSFDSFDKFLDRLNVAIAVYLKGQNLTTEVDAGAYASTGWHMRVRKDYAENDADALSEDLRKQLIAPFGEYNVGSWDDDIAPWPTWNLEIPEDQAQVSKGLLDGATAISVLIQQKVPVDWDQLLPRIGIPLQRGKKMPDPEEVEPEPEPEPTGGNEPEPEPENRFRGLRFTAQSQDGFAEGQLYVDALTDQTLTHAEAALRPTMDAVLEELDAASDFDDLKDRLRSRYTELDPEDITELVHRASVLADLAGRAASLQDQ
ncbi:MAG: DUF935 family protein [Gammaproteobacteria bacterium]|nr:DUF935 family protein [Gammaproteobacteria bacterium]